MTETIPNNVCVCADKTKHTKALRQKSQLRLDSMTGVNPVHTHGLGLWNNPRVVVGIRIDKGLYKAFKLVSKAKWGSTCNPIESYMAGVVGAYGSDILRGVNPSNTVNIGEIRIERNLRERRKLTDTHIITEDVEKTETVALKCGFVGCGETAVAKGLFIQKNAEYPLCLVHLKVAESKPRDWKVLA